MVYVDGVYTFHYSIHKLHSEFKPTPSLQKDFDLSRNESLLEEGNNCTINNILRTYAHYEISMTILLYELHRHFIHVVEFQVIQQKLHVMNIGERIHSAVAEEKWEVSWYV